jgi:hypothetical protein
MQETKDIREEFEMQKIAKTSEMALAIKQERSQNLVDAIEQHLKLHIKDEHAREDQRLKVFIRFCLEHKKVINSFIRANQ